MDEDVGKYLIENAPQAIVEGCFLCEPNSDLVIHQGQHIGLIAGLGPVVDNYCVAHSRRHISSLADLYAASPKAIEEIILYRSIFEQRLGPILMTEHGRVPVCRDDEDDHESHCYHAHALFFPKSPSIEATARTFYGHSCEFRTLPEALEYAHSTDSYMLISPDSRYVVLSKPLSTPRQLARTLVAQAMGRIDRADWRTMPLLNEAVRNADQLRAILRTAL
jgi:hypothetical protein